MTLYTAPHDVVNARTRFPAGLEQPGGSLRFGADALLLAAFVARHLEQHWGQHLEPHMGPQPVSQPVTVAELGSGCGAALLALALSCPQVAGLGLEREEALVLAARRNATLLGLADFADVTGLAGGPAQVRFARLDIADKASLAALAVDVLAADALAADVLAADVLTADALAAGAQPRAHNSPEHERRMAGNLHIVMANPPYDTGGRPSPQAMRERALRGNGSTAGSEKTLDTFCRAAAILLRHHGYFFCIHDARALPQLCAALQAARLGIRRILPVHTRAGGPALRVLVASRKNAAHDAAIEAPLCLHDAPSGGKTLWTAEALRFCPWLHRNPSGGSAGVDDI